MEDKGLNYYFHELSKQNENYKGSLWNTSVEFDNYFWESVQDTNNKNSKGHLFA